VGGLVPAFRVIVFVIHVRQRELEIPILGPEMFLAPHDGLFDDVESPITAFFGKIPSQRDCHPPATAPDIQEPSIRLELSELEKISKELLSHLSEIATPDALNQASRRSESIAFPSEHFETIEQTATSVSNHRGKRLAEFTQIVRFVKATATNVLQLREAPDA
jgi:hypothetical protein